MIVFSHPKINQSNQNLNVDEKYICYKGSTTDVVLCIFLQSQHFVLKFIKISLPTRQFYEIKNKLYNIKVF